MFGVQRTDEVVKAVQDILIERFENDPIAFGPIVVEPAIDHDEDDYMRITIVFEGDPDLLEPSWALGLTQRIQIDLSQKDIDGRPSKPTDIDMDPDELLVIAQDLARVI